MKDKAILLVEDSPYDVELTRRALRKASIKNRLVLAEDGIEALNYLYGESGRAGCAPEELPVVILLDLKLPRVDGHQVLRRIRAENKTSLIPVVILTSSSEDRDIIASYSLGANSYVRKPARFTDFVKAIRQLGLYWLILNEPPPVPRISS
jgi:two-component system response regulator